jgi:dienelactone hydrolase
MANMIKKLFLSLFMACSIYLSSNAMDANTIEYSTDLIRHFCIEHPIATSLALAATAYGICYARMQFYKKYTKDAVKLIDYNPKPSKTNYLFAHGLAETHEQAYWYTKDKSSLPYVIDGRLFTYDFPDATKQFWRVNFPYTGLGQHTEIMAMHSAYTQMITKLQAENTHDDSVIFIGMSRGATTILNFMGHYKPEKVKALIIESPFDSTQSIVNNLLKRCYIDQIPGAHTCGHYLLSTLFWHHSTAGERAIDSIAMLDMQVPILIICSKQDNLIPTDSSILLYKALRNRGHQQVHIFIAQHGRHGRILHGPDGAKYQQITHAFLKKYGASHDLSLAELGAYLLDQSQPAL